MINKLIVALLQNLPKKFVWIFSKRYIAGESLDDAVRVTKKYNSRNLRTTMDLLGEFLTRIEKVEFNKQEYIRLIETSVREGLDNSFSVKPTMFGLLINEELCYAHLRDIVAKAASFNRFVRLDMEDSQCTDLEIALFKRLLEEYPGHVGLVLQAYLKRTLADLQDLVRFDSKRGLINIRICKGIYNEPAEIAYKNRHEVNDNFLKAVEFMFGNNIYAAVATHDKQLVEGTYKLIDRCRVTTDRLEFQMLFGVTPDLRKSIIEKGFTMRIYVPYGREWLNYSMRRLKENPKMISYMIRALFVRG
jgi:proline dehydrogenase